MQRVCWKNVFAVAVVHMIWHDIFVTCSCISTRWQ